ncbi:MAG: hypothetical protein HDR22_03870 [Lachnospiraceae bacterium]|nr:hypothetical protein [Lachnospiraceae bacterium]
MMKKRLLALTLATTLALGSTMMVSAADTTIDDAAAAAAGQEVEGSSTVTVPTIKVTVPTTADFVINPYQTEYTGEDGLKGNSQIISAEQTITNESSVAVAVNVSELTAKGVSEGITIVTTAPTAKTTEKAAFLYLEVTDKEAFETGYKKAENQVVIPLAGEKVKAASKDAIVTLAEGSVAATTAKYKIGGSVVANPTAAETTPWAATDAIGVSFKFTFTPQVVAGN